MVLQGKSKEELEITSRNHPPFEYIGNFSEGTYSQDG